MNSTTTLALPGGLKITVPNSLDLITTYVLREQKDWFEDEIKFIRNILEPGQKVIDVGANYGVYTISMANLVGPTGCVWAFEPAANTARLLLKSIAINKFTHVVLEQAALSNRNGVAKLSLNNNSELNALVHDSDTSGAVETVPLTTLDEYMDLHNLPDIDFLKLDAEGEEKNILSGGVHFFSKQSPLIQYEVKAGKHLHFELIQEFEKLGYYSYRLVPGLNILAPFREEEPVDGYLLNLFCCKPDRAEKLTKKGILIEFSEKSDNSNDLTRTDCSGSDESLIVDWLDILTKLPYGQKLSARWRHMTNSGKCPEIESALSCYLISQNESLSATQRFNALRKAHIILKSLCETPSSYLRLASLARVAREYGARSIAVRALNELCNIIFQQKEVSADEPFLAPGRRFDNVPPENSMGNWIAAAALEELESNYAFSSYYTGISAKQRLIAISNLGFGSEEMKRRLDLVEQRFSKARP